MEIEYVTVGLDPQVTEYVVEYDVATSFSPPHMKSEHDDESGFSEKIPLGSSSPSSEQVKLEPVEASYEQEGVYLDQNSYHTQEMFVDRVEPAEVLYQVKGEMEESESEASGCGWFHAKGKKRPKKQKGKQVLKRLKIKPPQKKGKAKMGQKKGKVKQALSAPPCAQIGLSNVHQLLGNGGSQKVSESFICVECGSTFRGKSKMLEHMQTHMKQGEHTCVQCKQKFPDPGSLIRHVQCQHMHNEEYHCTMCGMRFQTVKAYTRHMQVHSNEKVFTCTVCGQNFRHKSSVSRHQRKQHPPREPEEDSANLSGYSSSSSSSSSSSGSSSSSSSSTSNSSSRTAPSPTPPPKLVIYEPKATPRTFLCRECGKAFNHSSSLSRHKLKHQNSQKAMPTPPSLDMKPFLDESSALIGKPHVCPYCSKPFAHGSSLSRHLQTHEQRPYQCPSCPRRFLTPNALNCHQRCHRGKKYPPAGKMHVCSDCGKIFSHSSSLSRHRHIHTPH